MLKEQGIILHPLSVTTSLAVTGFQKPLFRHNASRLTMANAQRSDIVLIKLLLAF